MILIKMINKLVEGFDLIVGSRYMPGGEMKAPPQCMPDKYKANDYVVAYRKYYKGDKSYFAKWSKGTGSPHWWVV